MDFSCLILFTLKFIHFIQYLIETMSMCKHVASPVQFSSPGLVQGSIGVSPRNHLGSIRHRPVSSNVICRAQIEGAGASGYAVGGLRPTSPKAWEIISTELRKNKVKFASPGDTQKKNVIVVDIRPKKEYEEARVPGAVNVEFFQLIDGWDPVKVARRAVYAFFGILNGTEFNPNFFEEFESAVSGKKGKEIILYCNIGGSLDRWANSEFGRQSRSLTAAYELYRAGYKKVSVLDGGMASWIKNGLDYETDA